MFCCIAANKNSKNPQEQAQKRNSNQPANSAAFNGSGNLNHSKHGQFQPQVERKLSEQKIEGDFKAGIGNKYVDQKIVNDCKDGEMMKDSKIEVNDIYFTFKPNEEENNFREIKNNQEEQIEIEPEPEVEELQEITWECGDMDQQQQKQQNNTFQQIEDMYIDPQIEVEDKIYESNQNCLLDTGKSDFNLLLNIAQQTEQLKQSQSQPKSQLIDPSLSKDVNLKQSIDPPNIIRHEGSVKKKESKNFQELKPVKVSSNIYTNNLRNSQDLNNHQANHQFSAQNNFFEKNDKYNENVVLQIHTTSNATPVLAAQTGVQNEVQQNPRNSVSPKKQSFKIQIPANMGKDQFFQILEMSKKVTGSANTNTISDMKFTQDTSFECVLNASDIESFRWYDEDPAKNQNQSILDLSAIDKFDSVINVLAENLNNDIWNQNDSFIILNDQVLQD